MLKSTQSVVRSEASSAAFVEDSIIPELMTRQQSTDLSLLIRTYQKTFLLLSLQISYRISAHIGYVICRRDSILISEFRCDAISRWDPSEGEPFPSM
jgi:hypothetical protein